MLYLHPVTPAEITPPLADMCVQISPVTRPIYVDVRPLLDAPANECFPLVDAHVQTHGGARLLGWTLWEMPGLFVEAEFHAVWQTPDGRLLDIAPKARPTGRILFLPTPEVKYSGRQVNNIRRAVGADPDVTRYLASFDEIFEFINRGERADLHGEIHLSGAEANEYKQIQYRMGLAYQQIAHRFVKYGPYLPCSCGSGKKKKWCHKD